MTTPMTRDEIVELMAREKAKYAGYDPDETWEEFDRNAAATDFMCGGVPDDEIFPRYIRWKEYAAECDAILRALEAAGCQIVQGEPVAVLLSGGDYPDELEFWNHGTGCLTEADKAAGCTEVLLFAKVQP